MGTQSLYVDVDDDVLRPRTDTPCADAPQQGIHLFHYPKSLCSQKVRQLLDEKGVAWTSHVVQLPLEAQYEPAYVRINPRCVVPTLVRDGKVTQLPIGLKRLETPEQKDIWKRFMSRQAVQEQSGAIPSDIASTAIAHPAVQQAFAEEVQ